MEIEKQTFRLPGQGVQLAAFLSVNNKVHVVAFRWVQACLLSIDGTCPFRAVLVW